MFFPPLIITSIVVHIHGAAAAVGDAMAATSMAALGVGIEVPMRQARQLFIISMQLTAPKNASRSQRKIHRKIYRDTHLFWAEYLFRETGSSSLEKMAVPLLETMAVSIAVLRPSKKHCLLFSLFQPNSNYNIPATRIRIPSTTT